MRYLVLAILMAAMAGGGVYYGHRMATRGEVGDLFRRHASVPTVEQVRELASLVTLSVPISDVQLAELDGMTGGVRLALAVHGDVQIAANLARARFQDIDREQRSATLVLPRPEPQRPRLDHEKTRVLRIERRGLWRFLPGEAGERALTNRAHTAAQRLLTDAAHQPELIARACRHTERIIRGFFGALDWHIHVQWDDSEWPAPPAALEPDDLMTDRPSPNPAPTP